VSELHVYLNSTFFVTVVRKTCHIGHIGVDTV